MGRTTARQWLSRNTKTIRKSKEKKSMSSGKKQDAKKEVFQRDEQQSEVESLVARLRIAETANEKLRIELLDHRAPLVKQDHCKPKQETLISFESGHYKAFTGEWKGDSVWAHFTTADGRTVHVNKDKVEYIQTKEAGH